jgi:hypothetical protein
MILTCHKFGTYNPLPINCEALAEPIFQAAKIVWKTHFSAQYHIWSIICEKLMPTEAAEVSG